MKRRSLAGVDCPVARTLDIVGDPWTLLIVRDALRGHQRFSEYQDSLEIPPTTLAARLSLLVDSGVLRTEQYQDSPARHSYHLTEKGRALAPVIITLLSWGNEWAGFDQSPIELVDQADGHAIEPVLIDRVTGTPLEHTRVLLRRRAQATPSE